SYATGCHTVFHHRYHIVWVTKYRYKVLEGALRERIRTIIRQVCKELGVQIVSGVLSKEHVHMLASHAEESHLRVLPEPCMSSRLTRLPMFGRCHISNGFALSTGSSRYRLARGRG